MVAFAKITTEHGFSVTLTSGVTYKVTQIAPNKWSRAVINTPHHGLAAGAFIPKMLADLVDAGSVTITVQFEGTIGLPALAAAGTASLRPAQKKRRCCSTSSR